MSLLQPLAEGKMSECRIVGVMGKGGGCEFQLRRVVWRVVRRVCDMSE